MVKVTNVRLIKVRKRKVRKIDVKIWVMVRIK